MPKGYRVFAGMADQDEFGFAERMVLRMVKAPYGDHRDWPAISEWAKSIARELTTVAAGPR